MNSNPSAASANLEHTELDFEQGLILATIQAEGNSYGGDGSTPGQLQAPTLTSITAQPKKGRPKGSKSKTSRKVTDPQLLKARKQKNNAATRLRAKQKMEAHAEALTNLEVQNSALKATIAELQLELSSKSTSSKRGQSKKKMAPEAINRKAFLSNPMDFVAMSLFDLGCFFNNMPTSEFIHLTDFDRKNSFLGLQEPGVRQTHLFARQLL